MANFAYTVITDLLAKGQLDLREAGADLRIALLDESSTVGLEPNVTTLAGFTTLGEISGAGYSRKALANQSVAKNNTDHRTEVGCDDVVYDSLDAGVIAHALIYIHITDDSDSIPLCHLDIFKTGTTDPLPTNGSPITLRINTNGFLMAVSPDAP